MQFRFAGVFLAVCLCPPVILHGQERGQYLLGSTGLNAGIQPSAGFSYANLPGLYSANRLKGSDGRPIPTMGSYDLNTDQNLFTYTSKYKILGGTFGAAFDLVLTNTSIAAPQIGLTGASEGIADCFVEPMMLGYHFDRVDFTVALGLIVPTGRFLRSPIDNNIGSGYWGCVPNVGGTFYLTKNKRTSVSATGFYEFHGTKRYTDIRPGQTFDLEGGIGQTIPAGKALIQLGAVGYGQWQTTAANGPVPPVFRDARYAVGALGPQASLTVPKWNLSFLFRYEPEFAASSHVEGTTMMFGATVSFPVTK